MPSRDGVLGGRLQVQPSPPGKLGWLPGAVGVLSAPAGNLPLSAFAPEKACTSFYLLKSDDADPSQRLRHIPRRAPARAISLQAGSKDLETPRAHHT